ncbi:hypothetical protein L1987_71470 [Smallanthus sonchifolius]|uniref:Uncharacterized protein n=1 Tax=Smallanthus sonchifolius TaxID=185202 RepID=A0ACB9ATV5_9ASTR|nr:hypothetical protein L1987_71470 [Smallanthus sonchifolius]
MYSVIRSVSVHTKPTGSMIFTVLQNHVAGKVSPIITGNVRSRQASVGAGSPTSMDKIQHTQETTQKGDVTSHTLEEGYTTRSDEEGFGGSFTGNNSLSATEQDKLSMARIKVANLRKREKDDQ